MNDQKPPAKGRPKGSGKALSARREATLYVELQNGVRPVNLSALAKQFGISRTTLMRYIDAESGLRDAIEKRRKEHGQGYVQVKRGTRATRTAAKTRNEQKVQQAVAAPREERPLPASVQAHLQRFLDKHDSWGRFQADLEGEGRGYVSPSASTRPPLGPDVKVDGGRRRLVDILPKPFKGSDEDH